MSVKSLNAVYAICHFSDWDITNLQLQKILYLAHKKHLGENDAETPLVRSLFQAWEFGPVVPHVYREMKKYGAGIIEKGSWLLDVKEKDYSKPEYDTITKSVNKFLPLPVTKLIGLTHREGGAWRKHYQKGEYGMVIPNKDIYEEYKEFKDE